MVDASPKTGTHIVCYCDDCQAFAKFLKRPDVLDGVGGTAIFQMSSWRLRITHGAEELRSMHLVKGGMTRFYTACCRTPLGNTMGARVPFIGLISSIMDPTARAAAIGEPNYFTQGRYAIGGMPAHAHPKVSFGLMVRSVRLMLGWWIRGRGKASPLFDKQTGAPRTKPMLLSEAEREALR